MSIFSSRGVTTGPVSWEQDETVTPKPAEKEQSRRLRATAGRSSKILTTEAVLVNVGWGADKQVLTEVSSLSRWVRARPGYFFTDSGILAQKRYHVKREGS